MFHTAEGIDPGCLTSSASAQICNRNWGNHLEEIEESYLAITWSEAVGARGGKGVTLPGVTSYPLHLDVFENKEFRSFRGEVRFYWKVRHLEVRLLVSTDVYIIENKQIKLYYFKQQSIFFYNKGFCYHTAH